MQFVKYHFQIMECCNKRNARAGCSFIICRESFPVALIDLTAFERSMGEVQSPVFVCHAVLELTDMSFSLTPALEEPGPWVAEYVR